MKTPTGMGRWTRPNFFLTGLKISALPSSGKVEAAFGYSIPRYPASILIETMNDIPDGRSGGPTGGLRAGRGRTPSPTAFAGVPTDGFNGVKEVLSR